MGLTRLTNSLNGRLLLASLVVLPLFVFVSGVALDRAFAQSQTTAEQERLRTHLYLLLGATEVLDNQLWLSDALQEPRFNQPESGLYARISGNNKVLWQSPSAMMAPLPEIPAQPMAPGQEVFEQMSLAGVATTVYSFDVAWELAAGHESLFRFQIFHDQSGLIAERKSYQHQLWRWLGGLTAILIVLQWGVLRWGLKPFTRLACDLEKLQSGQSLALAESYAAEINPVVQNLNQVILAERQQRDRYRNTLSDLAHSLKTPLAVIRSAANTTGQTNADWDEQISRMDEIIRHQLQRSVSEPSAITAKPISIKSTIERLLPALAKVYAEKNLEFSTQIDERCQFLGDSGDLMEVLGNLLENACKYTRSKVVVKAFIDGDLIIEISDDGPGIPEQKRADVLKRGARADTAQSGQGIGLAVAVDILSSYRGALSIEQSQLGGALFRVQLPNVN